MANAIDLEVVAAYGDMASDLGWSDSEAARNIDICPSYYYQIRNRDKWPSVVVLQRMLAVMRAWNKTHEKIAANVEVKTGGIY